MHPERIISLCPSLTELVFQLGVGERLVGVTKFCVEPQAGVADLPQVGGTKDPKLEAIAELAPDLVLMNEEENRAEDAEALSAAGFEVWSSFPKTLDDSAELIRSLGERLDRRPQAEAAAERVEGGVAEVRERAAKLPPVSFACLIWRKPWMALGSSNYGTSLIEAAGGVNVFHGPEGYPEFDLEVLGRLAPARVLLPDEPFPFRPKHVEELATGTGLPRPTWMLCDGRPLFWHGSQTLAGLELAERFLRND